MSNTSSTDTTSEAGDIVTGEVNEYMQARDELERFLDAHEVFVEKLRAHVENVNAKLEAADKSVRSYGFSMGPFKVLRTINTIDAVKLYELVGTENFKKYGGSFEQVTKYTVNKETFYRFVAMGQISEQVLDEVVKHTPHYSTPKALNV